MTSRSACWATLIVTVPVLTAVAAESRAAKVQGSVTYQGKPLRGATISFHPKKGKPFTSKTDADGSFRFQAVPVAEMAVTVTSKGLPKKYASPKTSGLKFTVKDGKNRLNIELK